MLFWGCSCCSNVGNLRCTLLPHVLGGMGAQRACQHRRASQYATVSTVAEATTPRVLVVIDGLHAVRGISDLPHIIWVFNLLFSFSYSIFSQLLPYRCPSFSLFQNLKIKFFKDRLQDLEKSHPTKQSVLCMHSAICGAMPVGTRSVLLYPLWI